MLFNPNNGHNIIHRLFAGSSSSATVREDDAERKSYSLMMGEDSQRADVDRGNG